jgi:hypothetical protein
MQCASAEIQASGPALTQSDLAVAGTGHTPARSFGPRRAGTARPTLTDLALQLGFQQASHDGRIRLALAELHDLAL